MDCVCGGEGGRGNGYLTLALAKALIPESSTRWEYLNRVKLERGAIANVVAK